ncbi:MAG: enoyl-CoA hydratase-related protein [Marinagarivorans sp.]|nr:enoyl-CoA hydratase-related protein [Marinagarivorans sp.]
MTELTAIEGASGFVKVQKSSEGVWHLILNRPERKNALSVLMYADLAKTLIEFTAETSARVLVLSGAGGCFTSGNDLADFAASGGVINDDAPIWQFMVALRDCPKPVVVAVDGLAIGIGVTLLLHVDAVFAAPNATFAMPFAKLGLCPEFASSILLPPLAGALKSNEWLLLGEPFNAEEALAGRLINAVTAEPLAAALMHANKLAAMPPKAIATTKQLLKAPLKDAVINTMDVEAELFRQALAGPEFAEAVAVFFGSKK